MPTRWGMARLSWPGWLVTYKDGLPILKMVTHPSTNRAWRWLTSLMRPTTLPTKPNRHCCWELLRYCQSCGTDVNFCIYICITGWTCIMLIIETPQQHISPVNPCKRLVMLFGGIFTEMSSSNVTNSSSASVCSLAGLYATYNKDQSSLVKGGIAVATPPNSSFVFARWQHRTDSLDAVCNWWLGGLVVSALGMRTRRPRFESRVTPLFHWVEPWASCLHTLPPQFLSSKKLGYKREFSAPKCLWWLSALD